MKMKKSIVTFLNQKGGVGKTSCCHHLAGALSSAGKRVLLLDNDPQASLTQGIFGPEKTAGLPLQETIAAAYAGLRPLLGSITWAGPATGIDLVPGSAAVTSANVPDPWEAESDLQRCLLSLLEDLEHDVVLIDCPPNLHLCSWAALIASTHVVVPVQAEDYGAQGLAPVLEAIERVRGGPNPRLRLAGFLPSLVDRRKAIHGLYLESLKTLYGDQVFGTVMPDLVAFKEAIARRAPVTHYLPKSPAAGAVRAVAEELLERLARPAVGRYREASSC